MNRTDLIRLAIALLDDEHGVSEDAWNELSSALADVNARDLVSAVKATEGRFYAPANVAEEIRAKYL
jgi:hypothetical protein